MVAERFSKVVPDTKNPVRSHGPNYAFRLHGMRRLQRLCRDQASASMRCYAKGLQVSLSKHVRNETHSTRPSRPRTKAALQLRWTGPVAAAVAIVSHGYWHCH